MDGQEVKQPHPTSSLAIYETKTKRSFLALKGNGKQLPDL